MHAQALQAWDTGSEDILWDGSSGWNNMEEGGCTVENKNSVSQCHSASSNSMSMGSTLTIKHPAHTNQKPELNMARIILSTNISI